MNVYLVRNFETKSLLGLYWANNSKDLWWEIDAVTDPCRYEYTSLNQGSLHFSDEEPIPEQAPAGDVVTDDFQPAQIPWGDATPSDQLWSAIHDSADHKWKKLPFADEPGGGTFEVIKEVQRKKANSA